ncbi:MAG: hypothetical protein ACFFFG_11825 [Candidatus Thorarchaeota archaeon]
MKEKLRLRDRTPDVGIAFWKLLPWVIMLVLLFLSVGTASGNGSGPNPPMAD